MRRSKPDVRTLIGRAAVAAVALIAFVAVILGLAGCGDRNLILIVDVLSYLNPAETQQSFGPLPAIPGGFATGEQTLVDNATINLVDNLGNVLEVRSVSVQLEAEHDAWTGQGADTLRMYLSEPGIDPRTTPAAFQMVLALSPGVTNRTSGEFIGDPRVLNLFASRRLQVSVTNSVRGPDSGQPLEGEVRLTKIVATVVAGRQGL